MSTPFQRLLINDEGTASLHHLDLRDPARNWICLGAGRDLQLIGNDLVLRSRPHGYAEIEIADGTVVRDVTVTDAPGGIESARRLRNGHTVVAGNGAGGIFVWELDAAHQVVPEHQLLCAGIDKVRMLRVTADQTFLFCSETDGRRIIHEADWNNGAKALFQIPDDVPADSMVKAVRVAPHIVTVSTGYAASLLWIDTSRQLVLKTIGGKSQPGADVAARPLSPFFFSGYQMFANGDFLISNWQGHSPDHNGQGYQLLRYSATGELVWSFDQTAYPALSSLNNVIALDDIDTRRLHDEPNGIVVPID